MYTSIAKSLQKLKIIFLYDDLVISNIKRKFFVRIRLEKFIK